MAKSLPAALLSVLTVTHFASGVAACDFSRGSWVYDNTRPYYSGFSCPFVRGSQNCARHGRPDHAYQRLRWQPSGCVLHRFDPVMFSKLLRNKVVAVVGDSVVKNFASSMLCMANSGRAKLVPWSGKLNGHSVSGLQYPGRNMRLVSANSNYLVVSTTEPSHPDVYRVELAKVDPGWASWVHTTEVIIFQATHWYLQGASNHFYLNGRLLPKISSIQAYTIAMNTVKQFLQATKYRGIPIFLSHSPSSYSLPPGAATARTLCQTTKRLSIAQSYYAEAHDPVEAALVAAVKGVAKDSIIRLIEVTHMSSFRPDSHLQNWWAAGGRMPNKGKDDCTHWCEAGVTDAWMDLVYNQLLQEPSLLHRLANHHATASRRARPP